MGVYRICLTFPGNAQVAATLNQFHAPDDTAAMNELDEVLAKVRARVSGRLDFHNGGPADVDDSWDYVGSKWGGQ